MKIPNGTYTANATAAIVYKSPGGAGIIAISFSITSEGYEGEKIASRQCLVRKDGSPSDIGMESMKQAFGWDGANPYRLAEMISDGGEHPVELVTTTESFTGTDGTLKEVSAVQWINPVGGSSGGSLPEETPESAFMAEFGAVFRAGAVPASKPAPASSPTPAPPKSAPASAPPARPSKPKDAAEPKQRAWEACQRSNPANASDVYWEVFEKLFPARQETDLDAADWAKFENHFADDVPF